MYKKVTPVFLYVESWRYITFLGFIFTRIERLKRRLKVRKSKTFLTKAPASTLKYFWLPCSTTFQYQLLKCFDYSEHVLVRQTNPNCLVSRMKSLISKYLWRKVLCIWLIFCNCWQRRNCIEYSIVVRKTFPTKIKYSRWALRISIFEQDTVAQRNQSRSIENFLSSANTGKLRIKN